MHTVHRKRTRGWRAIVLLIGLLLLLPLTLSGHRHPRHALDARSCAACILAHHSPGVVSSCASLAPLDVRDAEAAPSHVIVVAHAHWSPQAGRAPPALPCVLGA
jgi:hypothetical protein